MTGPLLLMTKKEKPITESLSVQMERAMHGVTKRVLFVEDDLNFCDYMKEAISDRFEVDVVCCDKTSKADAKLETETFDAAILDVRVTNGNGVTLYRKIIERWPSLQVIFLTGYNSDALRDEVEKIGPARIYSKDSMMRDRFFDNLMVQLGISRKFPAV